MKYNSKIIIGIVLALIIIASSTCVYAENEPVIINITGDTSENDIENVEENIEENITSENYTPLNTSATYNTTSTTDTNKTLPKTGVTDGYVVAILMVVCAASAIYAYKKISDYNIK